MIPNYIAEVRLAQQKYPDAWRHAHVDGDPRRHEWIKLFAKDLHAMDPNVGNNGKRGNPNDLSMDALNYLDPVDGPGLTPDGKRCWVIDVIQGAGGPNPQPIWNAFSDPQASSGAWVKPGGVTPPQPPIYPPYPPNESDVDGAGIALFADFAQAGQAPNPEMFRFAFRVAYSWLTKEVADLPASVAKHRKEWRALLGLP